MQLLVIRAGGHDEVEVVADWCDAIDFSAPSIEANGTTPLGRAMALALDRIEVQKHSYDANGIPSTRPWIFLISDGEPNDHGWEAVASRCRGAEEGRKVAIFPIGTEQADFDALGLFSTKPPKRLQKLRFNELFLWLSRSVCAASTSAPGTVVQMPATDGWSDNG